MEETQNVSLENVRTTDVALQSMGLPTLTEVRLLFWKRISAILERGRVRSEREYHLLRNVVDGMCAEQQTSTWAMLDDFNMVSAKQNRRKQNVR